MKTRLNIMDLNVNSTSMLDTNMFSSNQHDGGSNSNEGENRIDNESCSTGINGRLPETKTISTSTRTMFPTSQGSAIIGNVGDPKSSQLLAAGKVSSLTKIDQHKKDDTEHHLLRDAKMHQGSYAQDAEIAPGATCSSEEGGVLISSSSCPENPAPNKGVEEMNKLRATTHAAPASTSNTSGLNDNCYKKGEHYDNRSSSKSDRSAQSDCSNEHDERNGKSNKGVDSSKKKEASPETPGAPVSEKKDPYQEQSDRKRSRERKRRQDISAAIDKLITLLVEIDPENLLKHDKQIYFTEDSVIANSKRRCNGGSFLSNQQNQPLNRTEIINYTVHIIEKLAREREQISLQIKQYDNIIAARSGNQVQGAPPATQGNFVITRTPVSASNKATSTLQQIQQPFATGLQQQQQPSAYHQILLSPRSGTIVPPAPTSGGHRLVALPMRVTSIPTYNPIQFNHTTTCTQQWQQPQMQHQNFHQQYSANPTPIIGATAMPCGALYPIAVANRAPAVTTTNIMTTTNYKQSGSAAACCDNEKN